MFPLVFLVFLKQILVELTPNLPYNILEVVVLEKEIITSENIIKDLNQLNKYTIKIVSLLIAFVLFLILIVNSHINGSYNSKIIVFAVGFALLLIWGIFLIIYIRKIIRIKNTQFKIVRAKLIGKSRKISGVRSVNTGEPYSLEFSLYGKWKIYLSTNYLWTKYAQFSDETIYNNSIIGDEFYLVVDSKDAILVSYNSRFFEFKS